MQNYQIYKNLAWLNELLDDEAEAVFRDCCPSREWARLMTEARPFRLLENLYEAAENIWYSLNHVERLEAYTAQIKTKTAVSNSVSKELAGSNRLSEERFGFIFIVCPTGKSPDEILAICRARLGNSVETELRIATEEQRKITESRLNKLLERWVLLQPKFSIRQRAFPGPAFPQFLNEGPTQILLNPFGSAYHG